MNFPCHNQSVPPVKSNVFATKVYRVAFRSSGSLHLVAVTPPLPAATGHKPLEVTWITCLCSGRYLIALCLFLRKTGDVQALR